MRSLARSVMGETAWAAMRRAKRRLSGPEPRRAAPAARKPASTPAAAAPGRAAAAPSPAKPTYILEDLPDDSWKMSRHEFLTALHRQLAPRTYLETGVSTGASLALSRCRSIGIDPAFKITTEIHCDVALYRQGSDEFFARDNPTSHFDGLPIDLAFIDGMHLFEFSLRDFINIERHAAPHSVIVFDDMLPRTDLEAARSRKTKFWTGDVCWMIPVLAEYRPDLVVRQVDTRPTGVLVVIGADPANKVLTDSYDEIIQKFRRPDPQQVPRSILERTDAVQPADLLAHPVWADLVALRAAGGPIAEQLATVASAAASVPTAAR